MALKKVAPSIVLSLLLGAAGAAQAADEIRPGKWEFTTQTQMPNMPPMPQMPPGMSLPPGMSMGAGGAMTMTHTSCVESSKPVPDNPGHDCKIDKMERNGGTVTWAMTCKSPEGPVKSDGVAHYNGDKMDATIATRMSGQTVSQRITGRHVGPCGK